MVQTGDATCGGAGELAISADPKQRGRWLLHEAREQIAQGNFDAAEQKVAEVEALDIKWGLFDDTPTKVRNVLNKERPKNVASAAKPVTTQPGDHKTAKAMLREARTALSNHQYDQAESIAQEVKGWNLSFGLFEGQPGQGRCRGAGTPQARQDPQHHAQGAGQPGRLRCPGPGITPVGEDRKTRRGRGQGAPGSADERRPGPHRRSRRVGPPRHRDGSRRTSPGAPAATPGSEAPASWPSARPTTFWPRVTRPGPPPSSPKLRSSGSRNPVRVSTPRPRPHRRRSMRPSRRAQANRPVHRCWRPQAREGTQPTDKPAAAAPDKPAAEPASPAPGAARGRARQSCTSGPEAGTCATDQVSRGRGTTLQ